MVKELLQSHLAVHKSTDNPKLIVPDFESAEVIRYIFKLCSEGRGPKQIARTERGWDFNPFKPIAPTSRMALPY